MLLIKEQEIAKFAIKDMTNLVTCINDDVRKFCFIHDMDIYEFIDELDG